MSKEALPKDIAHGVCRLKTCGKKFSYILTPKYRRCPRSFCSQKCCRQANKETQWQAYLNEKAKEQVAPPLVDTRWMAEGT
jgi:hypothetical protein